MFKFDLKDEKYKKIHFIGIGGVSMSGIALLLDNLGYEISGSDRSNSDYLGSLRDNGIQVHIGQSKDNISDQDLFVYTDAISDDNEELIAARETGKEVVSRGVFLGALMRNYNRSIAISGSHGKSTTTSILAKILIDSESDASILLGGLLDEMNGNVKLGNSDILLTEACEFKGNILNYHPATVVILNIDEDHLDYYKDLNHIVETFIGYMKNLDEDGKAIINKDDKNTHRLFDHIKGELITFSIEDETADYYLENLEYNEHGYPSFTMHMRDGRVEDFSINIIGLFNIYNTMSAIIAAYENGISVEDIRTALKSYKNLHRRMELIGKHNDASVLTDYGHHPVEIKSTLKAVKDTYKKNLVAIFQPHLYSRTKILLDDFSNSFYEADEVIVTDIFAAREPFDPTIHSKDLVEKLVGNGVNAKYLSTFEDVVEDLKDEYDEEDIIITLGCGNPDKLAKMLVD